MENTDNCAVIGYLMQNCPTSADTSMLEEEILMLEEISGSEERGMNIHLFVLQNYAGPVVNCDRGRVKMPMTCIPQLSNQPEQSVAESQAAMMAYWYWLMHSPSVYWRTLQLSHAYRLEWPDFLQAMYLAYELHQKEIKQLKIIDRQLSIAIVKIAQQFYDFSWTTMS
jgi:hypothetical protein